MGCCIATTARCLLLKLFYVIFEYLLLYSTSVQPPPGQVLLPQHLLLASEDLSLGWLEESVTCARKKKLKGRYTGAGDCISFVGLKIYFRLTSVYSLKTHQGSGKEPRASPGMEAGGEVLRRCVVRWWATAAAEGETGLCGIQLLKEKHEHLIMIFLL